MEKDETTLLKDLGLLFLILIFIAVVFEIALLFYAYVNADEVECNLLWCTFKTTISYSSQECYVNGEQVNCSDFSGDEHFCNNGKCVMDGVCPGTGNMTIEECIKEVVKNKGG